MMEMATYYYDGNGKMELRIMEVSDTNGPPYKSTSGRVSMTC